MAGEWKTWGSTSGASRDANKKHNKWTGVYVTAHLKSGAQIGVVNYSDVSYFFSPNGSTKTVSGTRINGPYTFSDTLTDTSAVYSIGRGGTVQPYFFVETWTDNPIDSVTATMQYSSAKETPVISSSFKGGYWRPDTAKTITFTSTNITMIDEQYTVSSGVFYYKLTSASTYQSVSFTGTSVTIPANTLTTGNTYDAYADITVDDGTVVTVTINQISTVDAVPTVTPISPINVVLYGTAIYTWSYSTSTGTPQYAFDLQASTDNVTYSDVVSHEVTTSTSYTATVPNSGTIYWRVRGYNQDDAAGSWSASVTFINNIPPDPPVITGVSSNGRPTVTWSSSDQIAYQVQILNGDDVVEDSGAVYSAEKTYTAENYLPSGISYTVKVRIYNIYGKMSDWAEAPYTQDQTLAAPSFTLSGGDNGITVTITTDPTFSNYIIQRAGETIGSTATGTYIDRFANGTVEYTVIGVTAQDYTAQSTDTITFTVQSNMLISEDGEVFLVNHRMGSPVGVSKQINATYDQAEYIGATLPEHHFSKMREGRFTVVFKDYVNVENLLGQVMYYADMYGNGAWCAVVSVGRTENRYGNETSAELQLTMHKETVNA